MYYSYRWIQPSVKDNKDNIPSLFNTISRIDTLNDALSFINRTNTTGSDHKACICVVCDCFIIGTEPICWLTTEQLKLKECVLSIDFLESTTAKKCPSNLRNQYKLENNEILSNLVLSPRAHRKEKSYMSCEKC